MKLKDVDAFELSELRAAIEDEAWSCWYEYQEANDLTEDDMADNFEEAMENLWSDAWVEFLDKYKITAQYQVYFDGDEIQADFWDVEV